MRFCAPFILSCFLLRFTPAVAVYADEAYHVDYHHSLLGLPQPQTTFFHRPSSDSKGSLLYTLSERSILGAVNPKDGSLLWRHQLAGGIQTPNTPSLLKAGPGANIIVSATDGLVQAWDAIDGRLAWAWQSINQIRSIEVLAGLHEDKDVLIVDEEEGGSANIRKLSIKDGAIHGDVPFSVLSSDERIFYISLHSALLKGSKIKVVELNSKTGFLIGQPIIINSENEVFSEKSILYAGISTGVPMFIWVDRTLKTLKVSRIDSKHIASVAIQPSRGEWAERVFVHAASTLNSNSHFLVHFQAQRSHWAQVYHLDKSRGLVVKTYDIPHFIGECVFSVSTQESGVHFIQHTPVEVNLRSSNKATIVGQWRIQPRSQPGHTQNFSHVVSEVVSKGPSTFSIRSAFVMKSGDWDLIRNGDHLWTRPEGLAGLTAASFLSIATQEKLAEQLTVEGHYNVVQAYLHRLKRHARDLQQFPAWLQLVTERTLGGFFNSENGRPNDRATSRDSFGFRKLVVVATEHGRLAALDTSDHGSVLWNVQALSMQTDEKWNVTKIELKNGILQVQDESGRLVRCNVTTGELSGSDSVAMHSSLAITLPLRDVEFREVLIPVKNDGTPGRFPGLNSTNEIVIVTKSNDGTIRGWSAAENADPINTWQFVLMPDETILSVISRPAHDPVASIGKALGDRSVLYKYLNPNIVLLTAANPKHRSVTFYLLDSISGSIVYSTTHRDVDTNQPISSTISQNFFAYSLFSDSNADSQGQSLPGQPRSRGFRLVSTELYESPYPNERGSLEPFSTTSSIYPASANGDLVNSPYAISQSYIIPGPISHMSMTSTSQGITPGSLLCVLPRLNAMVSIPRHVVDPRRPVGRDPTTSEAEEGLYRYSAVLEFEPKWLVTHMRDMLSNSDVSSIPSQLESTSLLLAYGRVDIFGSRISPIGGFDILGKGFSKLQLVGTVMALGVGTMLLAPFVRKKQIDGMWRA